MPRRPCLDCGRLTTNPSRCDAHMAVWNARVERRRGSSTARGYGAAWRKVARVVMDKHLSTYGHYCPGFEVPAHAASDLTVDHIQPRSLGGSDQPDNLRVLCRGCNSRKHNRPSVAP